MKRYLSLILILAVLGVAGFFAFREPEKKTAEVNAWSVPAENGSISAEFIDDGNHGYVLALTGSGRLRDFETPEDAPWYSRSGRVSSIEIDRRITAIGKNAFPACVYVKTAIVPEGVLSIGANAFSDRTKVCLQGDTVSEDGRRVYKYSPEKPARGGYYWHMDGEKAALWDVTKVLFIGNSFTYTFDIDRLFSEVAEGAGVNVITERIAIGSHNVSMFANPEDEGGAQVENALTSNRDYDIVVLQEQSVRPLTNFELFKDGISKLTKRVSRTQDSARVYLYATWGYPKQAETDKRTIPEMEMLLRTAYKDTAKSVGAEVSPVGEAFTRVYQEHPEINLWSGDRVHPSYAGAYLSACVHAAKLLGIDPRTTEFDGYPLPVNSKAADPTYANDTDFSAETAEILREAAYATVFGNIK